MREHDANLRRAGALIDQAGRMLEAQRPIIAAAAAVSESAPFPVWAIDREHRVLWANREFEVITGMKLVDIRGSTFAEAVGTRYDALTRDDELTMSRDRSSRYRGALDGERYTRTFQKWPMHDETGAVVGVCGAIT